MVVARHNAVHVLGAGCTASTRAQVPSGHSVAEADRPQSCRHTAVAAAGAEAARLAEVRIASGKPLIGKNLVCEHSVWGITFFRDRVTTLYDIYCDDGVYVNAEATRVWRERRAADEARRAALVAQRLIEPEHNGHQVVLADCEVA